MNFPANYPRPTAIPAQSQPVLIALLCLLSVLGLTLAPVLTGASSTVPADVPLFDPNQYSQQELAASTLNDGIPDVWKLHYGLSITDPAVANADYNNSGLANAEKYHFNLQPFAPVSPEVPAPPVKAAAKAVPLAKAAVNAAVLTQGTKPADIGNFNVADVRWKNFNSKSDYKGDGFDWKYVGKGALGKWEAFEGTQMEVWKAGGEQFVELDASKGNRGIKLQVDVAGLIKEESSVPFVLAWQHLGRSNDSAGNNAYTAIAYTEEAGKIGSRVILKDADYPEKDKTVKKYKWEPQAIVFTVKYEDIHPKNAPDRELWIGFNSKDNNTYGALIKNVRLSPVGIEVQRNEVVDKNTKQTPWMSQSGDIRDLVSTWPMDGWPLEREGWIRFRVKIGAITENDLPPQFVQWEAPESFAIQANARETPELSWANPRVQSVNLNLGSYKKIIPVDVPDVGNLGEADLITLATFTTYGVVPIYKGWRHSSEAGDWSESIKDIPDSEKNALKHSYWMALCASDALIPDDWALLIGRAHENKNRKQGAHSYESTMDLHNNMVGSRTVEPNIFGINRKKIQDRLLKSFMEGRLYIWDSPGAEHSGFRATKKSNGEKIKTPEPG